jgi:hypothetical protein
MTPEQKLQRVMELMQQRADIYEEMLALMGNAPADAEDEDAEEDEEDAPQPVPVNKKTVPKTGKGCAECGSPSRHKSSCSKSKSSGAKSFVPDEKPVRTYTAKGSKPARSYDKQLNEKEFGEVCEQFGDGIGIENIAFSYPHVNISEVRKATISDSYDDCLTL